MTENLKRSIITNFKNSEMGLLRIKKNLKISDLSNTETEEYLKEILLSTALADIETKGKNHYFNCLEKNAILTVNSHSFTIITAKQIKKT